MSKEESWKENEGEEEREALQCVYNNAQNQNQM